MQTPPSPARTLALAFLVLALTPPAAASHDGDPINEDLEQLVCGTPILASIVNALPHTVGRCEGGDLVSPIFTPPPCPDCEAATALSLTNQSLTPAGGVGPQTVVVPGVPEQGPYYTPAVNQPVGTVWAYRDPSTDQYCVQATPAGGAPIKACVDAGPIGPLLPPIGPIPLVVVGSMQIGPTPPIGPFTVGPTPPIHLPATSVDIIADVRWEADRLNERASVNQVRLIEPVDLDDAQEIQWWVENGELTPLRLSMVLRLDGAPAQSADVWVPYAGQAAAATLATLESIA